MTAHAEKYSPGFRAHKGYTFWEKDFDGMAYKTMLRQLISKWGIMSIEMQTAIDSDMAIINEDGTRDYVDTDSNVDVVAEAEPMQEAEPQPEPQEEPERRQPDPEEASELEKIFFGQ